MLNLITISIGLFLIILTGWTVITYFIKKDSQEVLREELANLFDIGQKFLLSLKNLIKILTNTSLSLEDKETSPMEENVSKKDEQLLNVVEPMSEIKEQSVEAKHDDDDDDDDDDDALSSFSPEVIEVIHEEEEKVA
tara:strand:+ start:326 stop:736 length:411 start_codon:yes stop_codon:yes gene_type:complete